MKFFALILMPFLLVGQSANAISVSPMTMELEPTGERASGLYTITNPSTQPVAVIIKLFTRKTLPNGTEVNEEVLDKEFSVFPKATLIPPGEKKGIRVSYSGDRTLDTEKAYRLVIQEKPVVNEAGLKLLREFRTSLYVGPKNKSAKLEVESAKNLGDGLKINFINKGTAHKVVSDLKLTIVSNDKTISVSSEQFESLKTNFLSGERRSIQIPIKIEDKDPIIKLEMVQ